MLDLHKAKGNKQISESRKLEDGGMKKLLARWLEAMDRSARQLPRTQATVIEAHELGDRDRVFHGR